MTNRRKTVNRWISFLLSAVLVLSGILNYTLPARAAASSGGTITVAVERFAIGQGYLIEPYTTTFEQGDTYETVCRRILEENGYTYTTSGSSFYLSGIDHADTGKISIPDCIQKIGQKKIGVNYVDPPDNSAVNEYAGDTEWLGEFSYSRMSGWMYSVGDDSGWEFPGVGMDGRDPKDGDVYRLQFTVWGYGEDLTGVKYDDETTVYYEVGDKSALTEKIAQINQNKSNWFTIEGCETAYNNAIQVLQKLDATQKELDSALAALPAEEPVYPDSVTLQKTEASLYPGDTLQLEATISPDNVNQSELTWSSSDSKVASVDQNGQVTAQGVGTADITVKTQNNKTAVCHVTVEDRLITKITLNMTSASLEVGENIQLKVESYEPDNATEKLELTWSSSDEAVASVDSDGRVAALNSGEATITAKTKGGASATCIITVNAVPVEVYPDTVILQKTDETLYPDETLQLEATITPNDANHTDLTWSSSDSEVAAVDQNGLVTAKSVGTADITVKTENDKTAVCHITVKDRPITKITLNMASASLDIGESVQLKVESYEPENATEKPEITWSSDNEEIASVDSSGKVTALASGIANITARTKGGVEAVCRITVNAEPDEEPVYPNSVTLQKTDETLYPDDTLQLVATITPENATQTDLTWSSSNSEIASVDQNGLVTAKGIGTADITVKTENDKTAVCYITVKDRPITRITLNKTSDVLKVGESVQLEVESYEPENATEKLEVTWSSSNSEIASVDSNGKVTALKTGEVSITAKTKGGVSATCEITVEVYPDSVTLQKTEETLYPEDTLQLEATITPDYSNHTDLSWSSSNEEVASVDQNGLVTAKSVGTADITVQTENGKTAICYITVIDRPITKITLNMTSASLDIGESIQLKVESYEPENATEKPEVTWSSSNEEIASVDSDGKVTALTSGSANITARTKGGAEAVCRITVNAAPGEDIIYPEAVTLQKTDETLYPDDTLQLVASITPENANQTGLTWSSSDSGVASVDQNGLVTAKGIGTADITVKTENDKTAVCHITVKDRPITRIKLNQTSVLLEIGENAQLEVESYEPENATEKLEVTWSSSNSEIAAVDQNGLVTALTSGSATITAQTHGGASATCNITVEVYPDTVTLQKTDETLYPDDTLQLEAIITPDDVTHTDLTWSSSNSEVAVVGRNGLVTAKSVGTADITVKTENGKTAVCHITVIDRPITKITLNMASASLDIGESIQLKVESYEPENATEKPEVTWSSSNEEIVSVDSDGKVTALTSGSANITARTKGGAEAVCRITVNAAPGEDIIYPEAVTLQKTDETLYPDDTLQLVASITPENANQTGLTWSSSDSGVASVDQNGMVTARGVGTADITVKTENDKTAVCHITVIDRPITKITLNKTSDTLKIGQSVQLKVESYEPENATEKPEVTWSSSNEEVASVDQNGMVTALKTGKANITAQMKNGVSATCEITVSDLSETARDMEEKISNLPDPGDVTEENAGEVMEVWEEYSALDETTKAEISSESVAKLEAVKQEAEEILQKQEKVEQVSEMLKALPSVDEVTLSDESKILEARSAYDALDEEQQSKIDADLINKLVSLEAQLQLLKDEADSVQQEIQEFPDQVTVDNIADAVKLWTRYLALSEDQKAYLDTETVNRMDQIVIQVITCIEETVQTVDQSGKFDLYSDMIQNFIVISNVCDDMDADQLGKVSEETLDSIKEIRQWIGENIHVSGNISITASWYVRLIAEDGTNSSDMEDAVKNRYSASASIALNKTISYEDIRDGKTYIPDRDMEFRADISQIEDLNNPVVNTALISDGEVVLKELEFRYEENSMIFETSHTGTLLILSNPIEITGISVPSEEYVGIGNTISLEVTYIPFNATADKTVVLESSDPSIVKVNSDGTLKGIAPGSVDVTVSLKSNPSINAVCKVTVTDKANELKKSVKQVMKETSEYMLSIDTDPTKGSEWFVLGLARSGKSLDSEYFKIYYNHIANYLEENDGKLTNTVKYTEYSKMILVMTAIGKDARNIAGYNLLENLADFDMITRQGFNGPIWALIALKCNPEYTIPEVPGVAEQTTEQKLIDYLLAGEMSGGGWALMGEVADTDITAMTLQALAPYYNKEGYEKVTAAIDRAVNLLSEMQLATGGYATMGAETLESNAQVITALCALGIDPQKDARFIKNGRWTVENLISYHIDNSGFMHVKEGAATNGGAEGGVVNGMATEQGYYALTAYQRFRDGKTSLYDMSDLITEEGEKGDGTGSGAADPNKPSGDDSSGIIPEKSPDKTDDKTPGGTSGQISGITSNQNNGTSSGKTPGTTSGKTVGKVAGKTAGKTSAEKNDSTNEKTEPWSFDGKTYVADAITGEDTVSPEISGTDTESESAGEQEVTNGLGNVFTGDNVPYVLFFALGAFLGIGGYAVFSNRKKQRMNN